ncbi:8277_t:CDS:2, partial [Ambispora leptoticha]
KPEDYVPDMSRRLTLIFGIAFIIMALEMPTSVRVFSYILWGFVIVNIIIAIIVVVNIIQNRQHEIDNCIQDLQKLSGSNSIDTNASLENCTHYKTMFIIRNVVVEILLILFGV